jgi:hypothetical protein
MERVTLCVTEVPWAARNNVVRVPDTAKSVEEWLKGTPGELIEAGTTQVKP